MSLPLWRPCCHPERRWRGALWLACIRARVTPRPHLPCLLEPEHQGGGAEGCSEAAACARSGRRRRRAWSAPHPGPGSRCARHAPWGGTTARLRPSPAGSARVPGPCRASPRALLVAGHLQGPWGVQDSQPGACGTAAAGGKEPALSANHQIESGQRSREEAVPPLWAPKALAEPRGRWARRASSGEEGEARPAVLSRVWKISGKLRASCLAVGTGEEIPEYLHQRTYRK